MTYRLTPEEYEHTKVKLADCEQRLAELELRTDLPAARLALALRSHREFIAQLRAELMLFEAAEEFAKGHLHVSENVANIGNR